MSLFGRDGRKADEISQEELVKIRAKERKYRIKHKAKKLSTEQIKETLEKDLGRKLKSYESISIESEEQRRVLVECIYRYGGNVAAACTMIGVTRQTFNRWLQKYQEIADAIEEINEALLDIAEQQLIENIKAGKENSLFFFLCNKGKHRGWRDIRKLSGPGITAIKVNVNYPDGSKALPTIDVKKLPENVDGP